MAEERVIKIGMLGLGTVGTGVYKVLKSQQEEMLPKLGARVELKKILVRNVEKAAAKVDDPSIITTSFEEIANDPEIEIVVEVMGGKQPAMNYILACLDAGKNVVTANKDLVASEGKKILATAKRNGKDFLYEASVAGGIPSGETVPCRQSYHRADGYFQRYHKFYSDKNVAGRHGVWRCTPSGAGHGLCGSRPDRRCGRS